jgi:methionyl-tRNA formyltransferase
MKAVFFGTPAIAVPFLERLAQKVTVVAVVTNPDQPAGRGYEMKPSPVKEAAQRLGLPVLQPASAKDSAFIEQVRVLQPEFGLVVAYGKLLPAALLQIPRYGFLNVHFSLLPAYRGAAPIQWALINREKETGVTLFWLDEGMDTGPIFLQERLPIGDEDADGLREKLVRLSLGLLDQAVERLSRDDKESRPQEGPASRAPMLTKADGALRWDQPAEQIVGRIRGTTPWPGAFTGVRVGGRVSRLKILSATPERGTAEGAPGSILQVAARDGILVKCGQNIVRILTVQPEGKKSMSAWDFWQGARLNIGDTFEAL